MIAFSITCTMVFSQGVTVSVRAVLERDVRDLVERHFVAVVLDPDVLQQARVRAASAQLLQLVLQRRDALVHALVGVFLDVFQHGRSPS